MDISIKCDSLKAIYSVKNGMLRCVAPYEFTISLMPMIKVCIEEVGNRIITFTCKEEIEAKLQELKLTESTLLSEKSLLETEIKNTNQSLNSLDVERTKEKESEVKEESANREINALTNSELDHSINNAQKEVDKINEQIAKVNKLKENSTLYAQIDGTILNLNYTVGSTTSSEIPIVTIGENAKVFAEITVIPCFFCLRQSSIQASNNFLANPCP